MNGAASSPSDGSSRRLSFRDVEAPAHHAFPTPSRPAPSVPATAAVTSGRRYVRSRDGCLTCKRRKVKCDEQRPRCSHCERLNMECKWRPQSRSTAPRKKSDRPPAALDHNLSPVTDVSTSGTQPLGAVDEVFDYASFMWTDGDFWQQVGPDFGQNVSLDANMMMQNIEPNNNSPEQHRGSSYSGPTPINGAANETDNLALPPGNDKLLEFFTQSAVPPILAEVESQKKWSAMRHVVVDMAHNSRMVYFSILAFSQLILYRKDPNRIASEQSHYENAVTELHNQERLPMTEHSLQRQRLLGALFFLSYVDILESRLDAAHSHLKHAYDIFQSGAKHSFSSVEKQLLLWIRLVDGRAVSAGGDGLFLSKADELVLVEASPASFDGDTEDTPRHEVTDGDVEDVLFQVLYQPGIVFFQKVQSFMGRISKIDPWHRPRGTVEDETEVMNIGAGIATDLRSLYDQRPPLMDYAVAGKLIQPHISAHLAFVITRAFRTYLSNYYACKVHLHRVAYKTLPLTKEASDALNQIRKLARHIVAETDTEDALPVNLLWPLLMLGVEEQDPEERVWIKAQMLRMERVAGNARITAQVLEEVQARQDAAKMRMDIRSVMHAVFNSCFAIV
ncbi:Lysine biosynthesis regulatory protein LYS14 [Paramyrothecium foliicola]|nr:Lysine biosynthesis regulatory protein LYS14 [Paramyrothecium foliicola]